RRLGQRVTDELVDAAVGGIYAGDIEALSMRSALPKLWQMERQHGSLLTAMRRSRAASIGGSPRMCGFRQGLGQLTQAMARTVEEAGAEVRLESPVRAILRRGGEAGGYRIIAGSGDDEATLEADQIILAVPPPEAA